MNLVLIFVTLRGLSDSWNRLHKYSQSTLELPFLSHCPFLKIHFLICKWFLAEMTSSPTAVLHLQCLCSENFKSVLQDDFYHKDFSCELQIGGRIIGLMALMMLADTEGSNCTRGKEATDRTNWFETDWKPANKTQSGIHTEIMKGHVDEFDNARKRKSKQ